MEKYFVFGVLLAALALFITGRWRYDIVALMALLAVAIAGIVPAREAFFGFAHPAVITVAVLVAPIAIVLAGQLGVSGDPFLMATAVGASCAFLTPIGHQSNTLVMGPGGYRFGDYWRMGLPLSVIVVVVAVPLILWFWPP
jgi:di/tricarboxylate transporter